MYLFNPISSLSTSLSKPYPSNYSLPFIKKCSLGVACTVFMVNLIGSKMQDTAFELSFFLSLLFFSVLIGSVVFIFQKMAIGLFKNQMQQKVWLVKHQILFQIILVAFILAINFLLMLLFNEPIFFGQVFLFVGGIASTLIAFIALIEYLQEARKRLQQSNWMNQQLRQANQQLAQKHQPSVIQLIAQSGKEKVELDAQKILYIQAAGNYVEIHTDNSKSLLRTSLTHLEKQLSNFNFIFRCHRSYLVNLEKIQSAKGNSHKLVLILKKAQVKIPVSKRCYAKLVQSPHFDIYKKCPE